MTGGWKMLHAICPKCMEDKLNCSEHSIDSKKSLKSIKTACSGGSGGGSAHGQFDKNGCCVLHSHVQVAKKRVMGRGWTVRKKYCYMYIPVCLNLIPCSLTITILLLKSK